MSTARLIHVDNIKVILQHLQKRLNSKQAHVEFEFPFFIEKRAPITGAVGLMDYSVKFTATAAHEDRDFVVTVIVPVTTLCPCSKAISRYGAHNQRSQVTFAVRFNTLDLDRRSHSSGGICRQLRIVQPAQTTGRKSCHGTGLRTSGFR